MQRSKITPLQYLWQRQWRRGEMGGYQVECNQNDIKQSRGPRTEPKVTGAAQACGLDSLSATIQQHTMGSCIFMYALSYNTPTWIDKKLGMPQWHALYRENTLARIQGIMEVGYHFTPASLIHQLSAYKVTNCILLWDPFCYIHMYVCIRIHTDGAKGRCAKSDAIVCCILPQRRQTKS